MDYNIDVNYLFGINKHENNPKTVIPPTYADDQGNKVQWESLVDEIKTRKESWTKERMKGMKATTLLRLNVGMDDQIHTRIMYQIPPKNRTFTLSSEKWDQWGTRFFISVNPGKQHTHARLFSISILFLHPIRVGPNVSRQTEIFSHCRSSPHDQYHPRVAVHSTWIDPSHSLPEPTNRVVP